jgi:DNA-binding GntR family transcriptional regulator
MLAALNVAAGMPSGVGRRGDFAVLGPNHRSLVDKVTDQLAREIITGALPAGQRLREVALAEQLGVSRSPVREALRNLSREGLVQLVPRRGAQVADVNPNDAASLYECRMLLEPKACRLAVEVIDDETVTGLGVLLAEMQLSGAQPVIADFLAWNLRYHQSLMQVCPNAILRELVELTWWRSERYWRLFRFVPVDYLQGSFEFHHRLHEAVCARAARDAERIMRDLLKFALSQLTLIFPHVETSRLPDTPSA